MDEIPIVYLPYFDGLNWPWKAVWILTTTLQILWCLEVPTCTVELITNKFEFDTFNVF